MEQTERAGWEELHRKGQVGGATHCGEDGRDFKPLALPCVTHLQRHQESVSVHHMALKASAPASVTLHLMRLFVRTKI